LLLFCQAEYDIRYWSVTGVQTCALPIFHHRATPPPLAGVERWWILIGHAQALDVIDWRRAARDTQMVVLSGDPRIPLDSLPRERSEERRVGREGRTRWWSRSEQT